MDELIGPDTVNTMPEETILAYQDHGDPRPVWSRTSTRRRTLFDELAAAGVDYDEVTETLEREGVEKFAASFQRAAGRPALPSRRRSAHAYEYGIGISTLIRNGPDGNASAWSVNTRIAALFIAERSLGGDAGRGVPEAAHHHLWVGGVLIHNHAQARQPQCEQLVAEIVLYREHEAADHLPVQEQRRAHRSEHVRAADI